MRTGAPSRLPSTPWRDRRGSSAHRGARSAAWELSAGRGDPRVEPAPVPAPVDAVVDGPVENSSRRGITAGRMWMDVWITKIPEIARGNLLCRAREGSRNLLSPETETSRRKLRQRGKRTGNRDFRRVSGPGGRLSSVRGRAIGRSAWQDQARPLHLMHGGASHYLCLGLPCKTCERCKYSIRCRSWVNNPPGAPAGIRLAAPGEAGCRFSSSK